MIDVFPVKIEAYDTEICSGVFTIEAIDECCATVKIDIPVCVESWDEIAPTIRQALVDMKLQGLK